VVTATSRPRLLHRQQRSVGALDACSVTCQPSPTTCAGGPVCWLLRPARPRLLTAAADAWCASLTPRSATCQPSPDMHALESGCRWLLTALNFLHSSSGACGCGLTPCAATCQPSPHDVHALDYLRVGGCKSSLQASCAAAADARAQAGHPDSNLSIHDMHALEDLRVCGCSISLGLLAQQLPTRNVSGS
jgi:hypothetical protein